MIPITVKITDAVEAERALASFDDELKVRAVRAGLRRAAKPIEILMKNLAPPASTKSRGKRRKSSGQLRAAINITSLSQRQANNVNEFGGSLKGVNIEAGSVGLIIGPNKRGTKRSHIATWLEFGTDPHTIKARKGFMRWMQESQAYAAWSVDHPGIEPTHFMERSLQGGETGFEALFFQGLSAHLQRRARKQAKQRGA